LETPNEEVHFVDLIFLSMHKSNVFVCVSLIIFHCTKNKTLDIYLACLALSLKLFVQISTAMQYN